MNLKKIDWCIRHNKNANSKMTKQVLVLLLIAFYNAQSFEIARRTYLRTAHQYKKRNLMKCEDISKMLSIENETCPIIVDSDFRNIYYAPDQTLSKYYIKNCDIIYISLINVFPFTFIFIVGVIFLLSKELFI